MIGIGGSTAAEELAKIQPRINQVKPIQKEEFQERIQRAAKLMNDENIVATYVHSGTNLFYFTGMRWNASERMVGALILPNGTIHYIAPQFEKVTIFDFMLLDGDEHCWEEHESPFELLLAILKQNGIESGQLAMDEMTPFFMTNSLSKVNTSFSIIDATPVTAGCRMQKSRNEIAIMQAAMDITLEVHKSSGKNFICWNISKGSGRFYQ